MYRYAATNPTDVLNQITPEPQYPLHIKINSFKLELLKTISPEMKERHQQNWISLNRKHGFKLLSLLTTSIHAPLPETCLGYKIPSGITCSQLSVWIVCNTSMWMTPMQGEISTIDNGSLTAHLLIAHLLIAASWETQLFNNSLRHVSKRGWKEWFCKDISRLKCPIQSRFFGMVWTFKYRMELSSFQKIRSCK